MAKSVLSICVNDVTLRVLLIRHIEIDREIRRGYGRKNPHERVVFVNGGAVGFDVDVKTLPVELLGNRGCQDHIA